MPAEGAARPLLLEADLLRGMLAERLKRNGEALRLYGEVRDSGYRPLAVRGALAEIVLEARTGAMKPTEAIAALDKLRWQWRGDEVELGLLHRLGNLQIDTGDYRNGLQTLRAARLPVPAGRRRPPSRPPPRPGGRRVCRARRAPARRGSGSRRRHPFTALRKPCCFHFQSASSELFHPQGRSHTPVSRLR